MYKSDFFTFRPVLESGNEETLFNTGGGCLYFGCSLYSTVGVEVLISCEDFKTYERL